MRLLIESPLGPLMAQYDSEAVAALSYWENGVHPPAGTRDRPAPGDSLGRRIVSELREYFSGGRRDFELPLAPKGTSFQQAVWQSLRTIPFGETRSYGQVAADLKKPGASRAVGQANRRNPLPIIIPCHRVLSASGALGGYMGSSNPSRIKAWLLRHEGSFEF